jgi:hypothetical protein
MSKLPTIKSIPPAAWQKQRLARWLHEWSIDRALAPAEDDAGPGRPAHFAARGRSRPARGGILLLQPGLPAANLRLVYLAILDCSRSGTCLVAPYGRMAEPALPGELLTGRATPCLRVLCLWNARLAPPALLRRSWPVDTLSAEEMNDCEAVLEHIRSAGALPGHLVERVGPPLAHPADPRWTYEQEEIDFMDSLAPRWRQGAISGALSGSYSPLQDRELPLAAEEREEYNAGPSDNPEDE